MIGGNAIAQIQIYTTTRNEIGEQIRSWNTVATIKGFLDLMSGTSTYEVYSTKMAESTHIFICDYLELPNNVKTTTSRMIIDGDTYDVSYIDNPMGLNRHYEFYLARTGD